MPLDWIDVSDLSFNTMLLLERAQITWLPGWLPEDALAVALHAHPAVAWYLRHKCPEVAEWVDKALAHAAPGQTPEEIRRAEETILRTINDLVVYAVDPTIYDAQPFLGWDTDELTSLVDFAGKTVIDVGAGTGRLTLVAAEQGAAVVFAVDPVSNLRAYLRQKAARMGQRRVYPVDGLITAIPFPDNFADITLGGHVFGDHYEQEHAELVRVTKPGGMVILCPGNNDRDNDAHRLLVAEGFAWSRFEEPEEGIKRKYWKALAFGLWKKGQ